MLGVWIMEVGELAGMRRAEAETIKLYISKQVDRFRPAYGRRTQEFPRQCIFIGTTNEAQFLRDRTGNRRFWIVDTPNEPRRSLWDELTPETVRRVWAEAAELYHGGETLYLPPELESVARRVQESFEEENPREGIVQEYLERLLPEDWDTMDLPARRLWLEGTQEGTVRRRTVCTMEIWAEALGGCRTGWTATTARRSARSWSACPAGGVRRTREHASGHMASSEFTRGGERRDAAGEGHGAGVRRGGEAPRRHGAEMGMPRLGGRAGPDRTAARREGALRRAQAAEGRRGTQAAGVVARRLRRLGFTVWVIRDRGDIAALESAIGQRKDGGREA